ncbi:MAG TPA: DUF1080 domain-containing protein [Gemmatimonadaceae bacterium]|nr:DUF1080 domain-containing protein [Gemmatimonadaceae bacterium]
MSRTLITALGIVVSVIACTKPNQTVNTSVTPNVLSPSEAGQGWRLLFDGKTTAGWRNFREPAISNGWKVIDGSLVRADSGAGDIITVDKFRNFDLTLDWKVAPKGNSGIFYRATEEADTIWKAAPEMQVLDDAGHENGKLQITSAGANYDLYEAPRGVVHPAGEWNHARILVNGNHVEHWLNGVKLFEYELGSADWKARVAKAKFHEYPIFGTAPEGHIGLQDHGDHVEYRNIKIRALP